LHGSERGFREAKGLERAVLFDFGHRVGGLRAAAGGKGFWHKAIKL
jgi:hypothetical protein